jgi:hypothetical protein
MYLIERFDEDEIASEVHNFSAALIIASDFASGAYREHLEDDELDNERTPYNNLDITITDLESGSILTMQELIERKCIAYNYGKFTVL